MRRVFSRIFRRFSSRADLLVLSVVLGPSLAAHAQADEPVGYYDSATGTGATLKSQLHDIIDNHRVFSYGALRSLLQETDAVPGQPGFMDVIYDTAHVNVAAINPNGSIPGWDSAATWNREHTWPRSRGVGSSGPDNSDLHHLRPSLTQTNSDRGSLSFGGAFGSRGGDAGTISDGGLVWYPGDEDAGRVARSMFYTAVRYDGSDSQTTDLELSNSANPGTNQLGRLDRLLEWHYAAPVDDFERLRNDRVFGHQNNRNPFVDRPEYAWSVFKDQQNDSRLTLRHGTEASDGSSTQAIEFGPVIVGAALPSTQDVLLLKEGLAGTYYEVRTTGGASSAQAGRYNAFEIGSIDMATLNVGLTGSTATPGTLSGSVIIDNLDVTTGRGTGFGALDGDDTISLSLDVLAHANPSFAADQDVDALTLDLGQIDLASGDIFLDFGFEIFNLDAADGLTADLRSLGVSASGDTFAFNVFPTTFEVAAGSSRELFAMAGGSGPPPGEYTATYEFQFADADLPGATTLEPLTLTLIAELVDGSAFLPGDFNDSGQVEQGDLNLVLNNWGLDTDATGVPAGWVNDADLSGVVDQAELNLVLNNWGVAAAPALRGFAVPEPGMGLAGLAALWAGTRTRRRGLVA
ncbi:MAG: endonuclease [Planctomycetota bacterium]